MILSHGESVISSNQLQHSHFPFNRNPRAPVTLGTWNIKNHPFSKIRSALNELTSDVVSGSNGTAGSALNELTSDVHGSNGTSVSSRFLIERVFTKTRQLEEMLSKNSSISKDDEISMNLGLLEADLQAALSALRKKEEDLQDAERRILAEQAELHQIKQDLDRREPEIAAVLSKQNQMEENLEKANSSLASQSRNIRDMKLLVKDQSENIVSLQSSLSLKEDEMGKLREELRKKDEEAKLMKSEVESKKQLLDEASEIITKQEEKLKELQEEVREKEHHLSESLQLIEMERERLKITEEDLKKQTVEWLSAQEELKELAAQASKQMNAAKETSEDFQRVRALLSDLQSELILSQKAFSSSQKKMEDRALLLEKEVAELHDQKHLLLSYMNNLKDAELEVESERVKLRAAEAEFDEFKSQLADAGELIIHLKEEVHRERTALEQQTQEIITLRRELQEKELDYNGALNLLQVKESELTEARLTIEEMKSEEASIQLILQEKDVELLKAQKALTEVHNEIADLQKVMNNKEEQLSEATNRLRDKEEHIFTMQHELDDTKIKFSEAISLIEQIAQLSNKLLVSDKNEDICRGEMLPEMKQKQLEAELNKVKELLREKETDLLAVQRTLSAKEEELNALGKKWETREKELEKMKEESHEDVDGLKNLYSLVQKRIGDTTVRDLATEMLQREAALLEAEAATSALQRIHELTRQLVEGSNLSKSLDFNNSGLVLDTELEGVEVAEKEIARLLDLTDKLVKEAGITATTYLVS
ncbi:uncharacterized protein A4U43_C05F32710 [Asparagus officinalis]|uniref:Uncharacterized protein n=1 Tax=Asparagus officinalis TaxID=4686 RepID=A0A5P1F0L5_ASPOF|nr:golgin subfamily A member 6-like protein 6 [Asparagus officinalis]ONK70339.1 uncharacterized protein A4U43_C05F32710 [Asparagus officinalis]